MPPRLRGCDGGHFLRMVFLSFFFFSLQKGVCCSYLPLLQLHQFFCAAGRGRAFINVCRSIRERRAFCSLYWFVCSFAWGMARIAITFVTGNRIVALTGN